MKNVRLFAVFSILGVAAAACSDSTSGAGGSGASGAQASAARARFSGGPTASLTKANGARALSETKRQQAAGGDAMDGNPLGGGSGGASTKSIGIRALRILDEGSSVSSCADLQAEKEKGSCACPNGGSVGYDIPNLKALKSSPNTLPDEVSVTFTYAGCGMTTKKYDGSLFLLLSKNSVVKTGGKASASDTPAPSPTGTESGRNMLIVANNLTIDAEKLDFAFALDGGHFYYAPEIDASGGYVLTELSLTGGTKVYAKNGEFDCNAEEGSCTSDTGETLPIDGSGGDSNGDDAGLGGD